jgi:hypothetical protein
MSTAFSAGDTATAVVTGSGSAFTTFIPGVDCTTTFPFEDTGSPEGLPTCGGGPGPPPVDTVCIASPCLVVTTTASFYASVVTTFINRGTYIQTTSTTLTYTVTSTVTTTSTTTQTGNEQALVSTNPPQYIDASSCYYFTAPEDGNFGVAATTTCGAVDDGSGGGGGGGGSDTCAGSVVTYTYTTSGVEVVDTTTLPGRCILFSGGGNKMEIVSLSLLVWLWYGAAILSGIGMIVL